VYGSVHGDVQQHGARASAKRPPFHSLQEGGNSMYALRVASNDLDIGLNQSESKKERHENIGKHEAKGNEKKKTENCSNFRQPTEPFLFAHLPNDNKRESWAGSSAVSKQPSKTRAHAIGTQRSLPFFQRPTDRGGEGSGRPDRTPEAPFTDQFHSFYLLVPLPIQRSHWKQATGKAAKGSLDVCPTGIQEMAN
jgi:hypothetical protein